MHKVLGSDLAGQRFSVRVLARIFLPEGDWSWGGAYCFLKPVLNKNFGRSHRQKIRCVTLNRNGFVRPIQLRRRTSYCLFRCLFDLAPIFSLFRCREQCFWLSC